MNVKRHSMTRASDVTALVLLAAAGALASLPAAGCASTGRSRAGEVMGPGERLAKAWDFAQDAEKAHKRGRLEEAISLYGQAAAYGPNVAPIQHNLGYVLYERGNRYDAVIAFKRAAEAEPSDPRHFTAVGHVYAEAYWSERALEYYERALAIDPNYLEALLGSVKAAESLGRAEEVDLERVRRALLISTDAKQQEYLSRRSLVLRGRLERARLDNFASVDENPSETR